VGLDLLVGYSGLPSLGHAAFFGLAGYGAAISCLRLGLDPWLGGAFGVAASTAVAALVAPLFVRVQGVRFITITLAFGQLVWGLATRGGTFTGGENGLSVPPLPMPAPLSEIPSSRSLYLLTVAVVILLVLGIRRFARSPVGLSLRALKSSESRAKVVGYDVGARRSLAFVLSGLVMSVAGVLSSFFNAFVGPSSLDWSLSAQMLLSVVVGGPGSLWGPFMAGGILHIARVTLTGATERWPIVLGALYVATVVFLPGGLWSLTSKATWLRERRSTGQPASRRVQV
jgi:branched-chain amino acid transport system permease protein